MRCASRLLPPGAERPIRCQGEAGHPADRIYVGASTNNRCHYNGWNHHMWTDSAPDIVAATTREKNDQ